MKLTAFKLERLSTSRPVRCFRCDEALFRGERYVRGGSNLTADDCKALEPWLGAWGRNGWYHLHCALDVDLGELAYMLRSAPADEELDALRERVRARTKAINASKRARKGVSFKSTSVDAVDATCDPSGRPRVTIAYFGSMASAGDSRSAPLRDFARDDVVRTARREYVFELFSGDDTVNLAVDPSRPLAGAVFATFAHTRLVKQQRDKLALLRAFGVRAPVLWLFGPELSDPATRDAKVLELREALERAGFNGDDAVAVCSAENSAAALDELGRALDDLENERAAPLRLEDRFERAIASIESAIKEGADHSLGALIEAIPTARSTDPALDARAIAALVGCLSLGAARGPALLRMRRWSLSEPRGPLLDALRAILAIPGRALSAEVDDVFALLGAKLDRAVWAVLSEAITLDANKSAQRFDALHAKLLACDEAAIGERIRRWSEALPKSDKRKPGAEALAVQIASNAKVERAPAPRRSRAS
jgi:hypothetical protein